MWCECDERGCEASMRPGQVCPGKRSPTPTRRSPPSASMRPGQVCPGKVCSMWPGDPCNPGFNEARASLPGKGGNQWGSLQGRQSCFNEARASLPGKANEINPEWHLRHASMRPGQVCPGKQRREHRHGHLSSASMRPGQVCPGKAICPQPAGGNRHACFNEARASLPGKVKEGV